MKLNQIQPQKEALAIQLYLSGKLSFRKAVQAGADPEVLKKYQQQQTTKSIHDVEQELVEDINWKPIPLPSKTTLPSSNTNSDVEPFDPHAPKNPNKGGRNTTHTETGQDRDLNSKARRSKEKGTTKPIVLSERDYTKKGQLRAGTREKLRKEKHNPQNCKAINQRHWVVTLRTANQPPFEQAISAPSIYQARQRIQSQTNRNTRILNIRPA